MVDNNSQSSQSYLSEPEPGFEIRAAAGLTKSCFKTVVRILLVLHGILLVPYIIGCILGRIFHLELVATLFPMLFWISGITLAGVMIYSLDQRKAKCLCESFVAVQVLGIVFGVLVVLFHCGIELNVYQIEEHDNSTTSNHTKSTFRVMTWDEMDTEKYHKASPVFARLRECQEEYGDDIEMLNKCMKPVVYYSVVFYTFAIITIIYSFITLLTACCGFCQLQKADKAAIQAKAEEKSTQTKTKPKSTSTEEADENKSKSTKSTKSSRSTKSMWRKSKKQKLGRASCKSGRYAVSEASTKSTTPKKPEEGSNEAIGSAEKSESAKSARSSKRADESAKSARSAKEADDSAKSARSSKQADESAKSARSSKKSERESKAEANSKKDTSSTEEASNKERPDSSQAPDDE